MGCATADALTALALLSSCAGVSPEHRAGGPVEVLELPKVFEAVLEPPMEGRSPNPSEAMTMVTATARATIPRRTPLVPGLGLAAGDPGCSPIIFKDTEVGSSLINHIGAA